MGHSSEILTVDYYGDNHKLTAIILDRLDDYIETVLPVNDKKELSDKNDTVVRIETAGYLPKS